MLHLSFGTTTALLLTELEIHLLLIFILEGICPFRFLQFRCELVGFIADPVNVSKCRFDSSLFANLVAMLRLISSSWSLFWMLC